MPASNPSPSRPSPLLTVSPALGVLLVLILLAIAVARHPSALQAGGTTLLCTDIALLLAYALAALWASRRQNAVHAAIRLGSLSGLLLGLILVANHLTEIFVPARNFTVVIAPVFLAIALFAAAGSAARQRTGSLLLAVIAGIWCSMVGTLLLLCIGFLFNLAFEARAELWLQDAFAASGSSDPGAFLVRNTFQAASEGLLRMPAAALFVALVGALANASLARLPQPAVRVLLCAALLGFIAGAAALSHANSLERAARPPFVMAGILLAAFALSTAHPAWSALHRNREGH